MAAMFRFMRVIVFFDLPTETNSDKAAYRQFHSFLVKEGFVMMQKSVYFKLALNGSTVRSVKTHLCGNIPAKGLVQMLVITEKQFDDILYLAGESRSEVVDSADRHVII